MQKILVSAIIALFSAACAYKIDVQQGNTISLRQLGQVSIGMNKEQVRGILGTPAIQDPFHADRWDYLYTMQEDGEVTERYGATLHFAAGRLRRIEKEGPIPLEASTAPPARLGKD